MYIKEILAYGFSLLGLASMITASLIKGKNMKKILFFVFGGNFFVAISYFLDGSGLNGAASCVLGCIVTLINYTFESKNKPVPKWLAVIYGVAFTVVNLVVSKGFSWLGLLAIVACLMFVMCIGQKNGAKYRIWTIVNMSLWVIYDILSGAYSVLPSHIPQLIFPIVGVFVHDIKKKKKPEEKTEKEEAEIKE